MNSKLAVYIITVFILQFNNILFSQNQIPFFRLGTAQGLSQSTIFCSFQDTKGYIWFGTAEGLNRYDGYNFKVFRHNIKDSTSLGSNDILSLTEDATGNIWLGTRTKGVSILNTKTLKFDNSINHFNNIDLSNTSISTLIKDKNNNIWFSTYGKGLFKKDFITGKIKKIEANKYSTESISAAFLDKKGNVWFGNRKMELLKVDRNENIVGFTILKSNDISNAYIIGITEGNSENIYLTINGFGLFSLNPTLNEIKNVLHFKGIVGGENNMKAIVKTDANDLLVTTDNGLLIIPNENIAQSYLQKANSSRRFALSTHALMSAMIDKNKNLWIGTWEGGINVNYKKQPIFTLLRHEPGVLNGPLERKITSVAANDNKIWLGTNIGLSEYNRDVQTWKHYNELQLSGNDVNSMKYDAEGDLFVSVYQRKLNVIFKDYRIKQYNLDNEQPNDEPTSISCFGNEKNGKMWIGTHNSGVFLFDKKSGKSTSLKRQFPKIEWNFSITCVFQDSKNRLWIGTFADGLYELNLNTNSHKVFKSGAKSYKIIDDHIQAILQNKKGEIWVGTNGGGLNLFNEKAENFISYLEQDGLPNNTIKAMVEDATGKLWLSTNQGMSGFDISKKEFKNYNEADGLQGKEFGRGVGTINNKGELFFGGINGLSYFNPKDLKYNQKSFPKIIFTDLKLFNKTVEIGQKGSPLAKDISLINELTLNHNQSVFSIDFLVLDFQQLKNYQYAYKLDGFDKDWNYIGNLRSATYTNIPEGNYIFKVKATNNSGEWGNNISQIKLVILPPWYKSTWAYLFYCIALFMSLYFWRRIISIRENLLAEAKIQRIEANKIKELDIAKTNFFTNISHEFRTPLTLIISPLQQLMQGKAPESNDIGTQHNIILKNALRLQRLINQILDISKLEAGNLKLEVSKNDLNEFLNSIALSFKVLASQNEIEYLVNIKLNQRYCFFDKDIIEKITYNLLSNAFKFTPKGGIISFLAEVKNGNLKLQVNDTGIGMDPETIAHIFDRFYQAKGKKERKSIGSGIGLSLTKELIELHMGSIEVVSSPNNGSNFSVEIPVTADKFDLIQIKEDFNFTPENLPTYFENQNLPNQEIVLENDSPLLLIVEDNDELREYIIGLFEKNYKILEAPNGKIGLEMAVENLPDLIISDYMMPIMDGGELCKAIKTDERTSHIPFIMLTSKQNTATINSSYENGVNDYIIKPFNVTALVKKVNNIIRSRELLKQKFGKAIDPIPENYLQNETEEKFFAKIIEIINVNIEDTAFDVSKLENQLNMSKMQLYRKLKGVSNLGPNEFIRNIRLKKSMTLLKTTNQNISEIAYSVGFSDPAYFTRCFRKEFGKAPTEYINRKV